MEHTRLMKIEQSEFWKQSATINAVKCGHVEQCAPVLNIKTFQCNDIKTVKALRKF